MFIEMLGEALYQLAHAAGIEADARRYQIVPDTYCRATQHLGALENGNPLNDQTRVFWVRRLAAVRALRGELQRQANEHPETATTTKGTIADLDTIILWIGIAIRAFDEPEPTSPVIVDEVQNLHGELFTR